MNRLTYDVTENFQPVDNRRLIKIITEGHRTLLQGPYEKIMEHAAFLIRDNRSLTVKFFKNNGFFSEIFLISQ